MSTKVLRDAACPMGKQCPQIARTNRGYEIVGTDVPDATLPAHERRVLVPATMLPELGGLDIFEDWLGQRRTAPGDMLRVQTRRAYAVSSDDADFAGYLAGAAGPVSPCREPFFSGAS